MSTCLNGGTPIQTNPMPYSRGDRPALANRKRRALLISFSLSVLPPGISLSQGQVDLSAIQSLATKGEPEALNALANAYAGGHGVGQDWAAAIRLYRQAADRGHAPAHFNLGLLHELGRGIPPDVGAAFGHYLKAAELGFTPAQFNVGNMYANGHGASRDLVAALRWFRQAADAGLPEAQYNVALAHEHGRGVARDEAIAQRWYRAAAEQGYARAQFNLGLMLAEGRGAPRDLQAAVRYYRAAATQNFAPAQHNLGLLLAEGGEVPANLVEAYQWLALAAESGMPPNVRDSIAHRLTAAELAQANLALAAARSFPPPAAPAALASPPVVDSSPRQGNSETASPTLPGTAAKREGGSMTFAPQDRGLAASPLGLLGPSLLSAPRASPPAEKRQVAVRTSELSLQQLAANDPRIAKLISENASLNEEMAKATLKVIHLTRRLSKLESNAAEAPAVASPAENAGRIAQLNRQVEVLRNALSKLAEENRWHIAAAAARSPAAAQSPPLKAVPPDRQ